MKQVGGVADSGAVPDISTKSTFVKREQVGRGTIQYRICGLRGKSTPDGDDLDSTWRRR